MHSLLCSRSLLPCMCRVDGAQPVESYRVTNNSISLMSKMGAYLTVYNYSLRNPFGSVFYSLRNPFGSVFIINNLKPIINPKEYKSRKGNIIQTNQGPEGAGIRRVIAN